MKKRNSQKRAFKCTKCGERATAFKRISHFTGEGHIKTMWCYKCKAVTDFYQLSKWET